MDPTASTSRAQRLLTTLPVLLLLLAAVFHWTAGQFGGRIIQFGEHNWPGYGTELRRAPERPSPPEEDEKAEDSADKGAAEKAEKEEAADDDLIDDLLGDLDEGEADPGAAAAAEEKLRKQRQADYERLLAGYEEQVKRRTSVVKAYAALDRGVENIVSFINDRLQEIFVLLVAICGVVASTLRHHIALRSPVRKTEDRVAAAGQLIAAALMLSSVFAQTRLHKEAGVELEHPYLPVIWGLGFAALVVVHGLQIWRPRGEDGALSPVRALLCVPLYAWMAMGAGGYFLLVEQYPAGIAVYLQKLANHYTLYLQVGLYVWAGMLLKRTRVAEAVFLALRPLRLAPELLVIIVVLLSAIPTAYSGGSGIFVIAAGATVFAELRRSGTRPQLALAATAMSGALGVVLRPCLLVVIITFINPVSTDELFEWGGRVFLLTGLLFSCAVLLSMWRNPSPKANRDAQAPPWLASVRPFVHYAIVFAVLTAIYALFLGVNFDLHSAPMVLPVVLILFLPLDRRVMRDHPVVEGEASNHGSVRQRIEDATSEASIHVGALLMLMGSTACVGGVIERAQLLSLVPSSFASVWWAMALLVVVLVLIGMSMEPYGAVLLVSGGVAQIAYANGIDPIHFWMVVLVAFELGYLTPPVALNQLLVRQVVGEAAITEAEQVERAGYWWRHERILLPVAVMGVALLLVAFVPLMVGYNS